MQHSPGFLRLTEDALKRVTEISVGEAAALTGKKDVTLVDVREESEWNAGHADGAIHLSKGIIERDIEERIPDRDRQILCYCGGGYRSALAADNLQKMGYAHVFSVAGGYKAWVAAGLRTTTRPEIVPRSPHDKLGGIMHLPRLIDKARLAPAGKLPGYHYLTIGFDKLLLDLLCVEGAWFEQIVASSPDDMAVLGKLKERLGPAWPSDHAIYDFNDRLGRRKPETPDRVAAFEQARAKLPPSKKKVETFCDLIDLEEGRLS